MSVRIRTVVSPPTHQTKFEILLSLVAVWLRQRNAASAGGRQSESGVRGRGRRRTGRCTSVRAHARGPPHALLRSRHGGRAVDGRRRVHGRDTGTGPCRARPRGEGERLRTIHPEDDVLHAGDGDRDHHRRYRVGEGAGLRGSGDHWVTAALGVAALLSILGFGVILPNEARIYREIVSPTPDVEKISRLGMRNAKLGGVQGLLQLLIIPVMVNLRL